MRAILMASLLVALALAGCSSAPTTHVCATGPKAGQTIDLTTATLAAPAHGNGTHDDGPEAYCPPHVAPSMFFTKIPKNLTAYQPFTLEWKVSNGTYAHGHAMLSVVMSSPTAVTGSPTIKAYTTELAKKEHQEVPATFTSATLVFEEAGMRHLRIFSNVQGDGLALTTFHSDEVMLTINPVKATGNTITVSQAVGEAQGAFAPSSANAKLGDAVVFTNNDLREHSFTITQAPAGFTKPAAVSLGNGESSTAVLLDVPGSYTFSVDTLPSAKTTTVSVVAPT